jgi:hypothetical protein
MILDAMLDYYDTQLESLRLWSAAKKCRIPKAFLCALPLDAISETTIFAHISSDGWSYTHSILKMC